MSEQYSSVFASQLSQFVATKRAIGCRYDTAAVHLRHFDRYCCRRDDHSSLDRELVLDWSKKRDNEGPRTHRVRISPIREFGKYLQSIGVSDAYVLPGGLTRKVGRYVPHFFTKAEITAFFTTCDNLGPHGAMRVRHLVLPVFFRLLYCCGLRTCEARTLKVEDVDLQTGHIRILRSKGERSRSLPLPQDLLELFKRYDAQVSKIYPDRIYFFPTTRAACYCCGNLATVFRKIWNAAGLPQTLSPKPRAYDFRHHLAFSTLNRWITSGVDVNCMLPYLSRYMGHGSLESTDYYLHLVPEFFHAFSEKVKSTETLLPEPDYEQE